jgi:hypothetical protein
MEQSSSSDDDGIPHDGGNLAATSRSRESIAWALARSPRRIFGAELIRELASSLDKQRKKEMPIVTPCRLALALRRLVSTAEFLTVGSAIALGRANDTQNQTADLAAKLLPDATTAKAAKKRLAQAKQHIDKFNSLVKSEEIRAFKVFSSQAHDVVHNEIVAIEKAIVVPVGLRRGRPTVSLLVKRAHEEIIALTGKTLRGSRDADNPDKYISDLLFRICMPMLGEGVRDGLGLVIETAIKTRQPKRRDSR